MSESKTSVRLIKAVERQKNALELRIKSWSYAAIAEELGYRSPSGALKAVDTALLRTLKEPAETVRTLELARLDKIRSILWDKILAGNLKAVDAYIAASKRYAQLLGLDAPTKITPTDITGERPLSIEYTSLKIIASDPRLAKMAQELAIAMESGSSESSPTPDEEEVDPGRTLDGDFTVVD